jgi:uncharacterized surface protein with fasciclin (FAS1) repeats
MKTFNRYISSTVLLIAVLCSCSDNWSTHYTQGEQSINNESVEISTESASAFLKNEAGYSEIYKLLKDNGVIDSMATRNQLFTLFVVPNGTAFAEGLSDDMKYLAQSHITDLSLSPANLVDGQRILLWNGKYATVAKTSSESGGYSIAFNGSNVSKVIKVNNGYIYVLDKHINTPRSMYEIIEHLGDEYSIFREMVMSRNVYAFDKAASKPIGVDKTGNTVYDSVFTTTNPYFAAKGFDITSESLNATIFIPSNDVINSAWQTAQNELKEWGVSRADSIVRNWVFQAAFFNKKYTKAELQQDADITSVFSKQWRLSVQQLDLDNPISMSNGIAYYVKSMRIPTNVLIYRLKDFSKWYEFLTADQKASYFATTNLTYSKIATEVAAWSGWPEAGFPTIENRVVYFTVTDTTMHTTKLDFTPLHCVPKGDGTYAVSAYKIPPGEYDLCLGFKQSMKFVEVGVSFNDVYVGAVTYSQLTTTTFHYDRGGQGYPEGYSTTLATNSKKNNYDRDGGKVGVVKITGTEAVPVKISLSFKTGYAGTTACYGPMIFNHWCLRPTTNCY